MVARKYTLPGRNWLYLLGALFICANLAWAQSPATGKVWSIVLNSHKDTDKKVVARKHFYLISGVSEASPVPEVKALFRLKTLETALLKLEKDKKKNEKEIGETQKSINELRSNFFKSLIAAIGRPPTLQDYQAMLVKAGLAETKAKEFIDNWILGYRCETIFCQDIAEADLTKISLFKEAFDANAPLFAKATDANQRALRWLPNFLPAAARTGYFEMRRKWAKCAVAYLQASPTAATQKGLGLTIAPAMTNNQGKLLFPNVPVGLHFISNLLPLDVDSDYNRANLWLHSREISLTEKTGYRADVSGASGLPKSRVEIKSLALESVSSPTFTCEP